MSPQIRLGVAALGFVAGITFLHLALNTRTFDLKSNANGSCQEFRVGFLPVTCHLTCPVTHFINEQ